MTQRVQVAIQNRIISNVWPHHDAEAAVRRADARAGFRRCGDCRHASSAWASPEHIRH